MHTGQSLANEAEELEWVVSNGSLILRLPGITELPP